MALACLASPHTFIVLVPLRVCLSSGHSFLLRPCLLLIKMLVPGNFSVHKSFSHSIFQQLKFVPMKAIEALCSAWSPYTTPFYLCPIFHDHFLTCDPGNYLLSAEYGSSTSSYRILLQEVHHLHQLLRLSPGNPCGSIPGHSHIVSPWSLYNAYKISHAGTLEQLGVFSLYCVTPQTELERQFLCQGSFSVPTWLPQQT